MSKWLPVGIFVFLSLMFVSPVFAEGTLNITTGGMTSPSYINTKDTTVLLNITLNVTIGEVNVTGILINFTGNATMGNISAVMIYNDSNNDGSIAGDALFSSNSTINATTNSTKLNFPSNLTIPINTAYYLLVAINISGNASEHKTIGVNLTSNTSIITAGDDNVTIYNDHIDMTPAYIQDVHANASVTPRYVDTNVENQTISYLLTMTGSDTVSNISIVVPAEYSIVSLLSVTKGANVLTEGYSNTTSGGRVNISLDTATREPLRINFSVNTNASSVSALQFNATITGSNLTDIETDVVNDETNITTQQIINVDSLSAIKTAALINGTDYWKFNFTLNITANVSGFLQFKMSNWNNSASQTINLTNQTAGNEYTDVTNTDFYATLWHKYEGYGNYMNVTNDYNITNGIYLDASSDYDTVVYNFVLKMIIPVGTPVASDWWSTYNIIFRTSP